MKFEKIVSGEYVFIDANIFIYHFTGVSDQCSDFLNRCEQKDLIGITSTNVLLEVLHRLMMIEVVKKKLIDPPNIVKKLQKKPVLVKQLSDYYFNAQKIYDMGIAVKPISYDTFVKGHFYRGKYGLLVNDSIIAASAQQEGINILATNDDAFLKLDEFKIYQPYDVNLDQ